ncbi:MAG: HDIG domain-containing protein [Proteobacteria bacterium]|nr:HDIG domain-containing protein [Pseudomonadota bacterium]
MKGLRNLWNDFQIQKGEMGQLAIMIFVCALVAILVVDFTGTPTEELREGDVAPRTIKAPLTFTYKDFEAYEKRRQEARDQVLPVYMYEATLSQDLKGRIRTAFEVARARQLALRTPETEGEEQVEEEEVSLTPEQVEELRVSFRAQLGVQIADDDLGVLIDNDFPPEAETLAIELLGTAMAKLIISDRSTLKPEVVRIRIIELRGRDREEMVHSNLEEILIPAEARQLISITYLEKKSNAAAYLDSAATLARALVRPNLSHENLETAERRNMAAAGVPPKAEAVKRGAILFREGDSLTKVDLLKYQALQEHRGGHSRWMEFMAICLFLFLLLGSLYHFGASFLEGFSTRSRDAAAVGFLLVLTTLLARAVVAGSENIALMVGHEAGATSVWFMVPVAGSAMLVRLLVGVGWSVVFSMAAASICGLLMDLQALSVVFYLLSAVAATGAIEHTRERMAVVRAGLYTGLVNAAAVLLIHFLQLFVVEGEISMATTMRPVWSMSFAVLGGILSSFLVLGLVPLFEVMGFVTDYRMMELANLNHPLLRQLMLRAPGSYHHSVLLGTLVEAACEAIGANALQAKVASYFHDIGKSLKPQYFVENQRGSSSKHANLDPYSSAKVVINHVVDGGRMAREYGLPKPIIDNIYMHHGEGLLLYFFAQAQETYGDDVDESKFRYPGPKPNTREAGIIMLADKVEAATRTIRSPNETNIRAMINRVINSVVADGQFSHCPLTFQELHTIGDTFVKVLLGIYHQRIEYPQTADVSRASGDEAGKPQDSVITLELLPPTRPAAALGHDYEAVEHLPREES